MTIHKTTLALLAACCLVLLVAAGIVSSVDYEEAAERIVTQSADIQEGDKVLIFGTSRDQELLENLAVHVRKRGAFPMIVLGSDRMTRRMFTDVPEQYDSQQDAFMLEMAGVVDALITVEGGEDPALLADIEPARFTERSKANEAIAKTLMERGVKRINLGNDLYPTEARATQLGMGTDELAELFWNGVNVDYEELNAVGEAIRSMFASGRELHLTNPNGTDLRMQVTGRDAYVSDGMISPEEVEKGGAATSVWLPAGEVYLTPVPGTATGTVVIDRSHFQGDEIRDLRLTFEAGRLTNMEAVGGAEALQSHYAVAGEGKDHFAVIDVGLNEAIPQDDKMLAWMPAGMVTVGFGNNQWAGGENAVGFAHFGHLPGSSLLVDGTPIVQEGKLAVAAPPTVGTR